MDADNPVVSLCVDGMRAEGEGRNELARKLFRSAWDAATDDYEACIAAHYVARHQDTPEGSLRWNLESLRRADAVGDGRVREFYPSLYLNVAHSFELAGDTGQARRYLQLAAASTDEVTDDRYGQILRGGIAAGQWRTAGYIYLWEFLVVPGSQAEFERHYGADGSWVTLFRQAAGYIETRLLRDRANPCRYITIDSWRSLEAYRAFRDQFAAQYEDLDRACQSLTTAERPLGEFGD